MENPSYPGNEKMTNYRWVICAMLFVALVVNYLDRQVLSLTWKNFIAPEFNWTDADYGRITGIFSIVYAVSMLFAGKFIDYVGTKRGYLWAIGIWSAGACMHAFCGVLTDGIVTGDWNPSFLAARENLLAAQKAADVGVMVTTVSVWLFIAARVVLSVGEAGNFPSSIKAVAEYFPKKDRGFATGIFNSGAQIGALMAPFTIPLIAKYYGWEMAFLAIGILGFIWMGFWGFIYKEASQESSCKSGRACIYRTGSSFRSINGEGVGEERGEDSGGFQGGSASGIHVPSDMGCDLRTFPPRFRMVVPAFLGTGIYQRSLRLLHSLH